MISAIYQTSWYHRKYSKVTQSVFQDKYFWSLFQIIGQAKSQAESAPVIVRDPRTVELENQIIALYKQAPSIARDVEIAELMDELNALYAPK